MVQSRRQFLQTTMAVGAAAAISPLAFARHRPAKLRILILGGTGFLGPAIVEEAHKRGHDLTLFNRGKREKTKGTTFDFATRLHGNRDPNKLADEEDPTSSKGLSELEALVKGGTKWDAVIDTSGYFPRIAKASAELLSPAAGMYVFISTLSVYAANDKGGMDESAPLGTMADPTVEDFGKDFANYGPAKALCEQAVEAAFSGRTLNLRPGYIVGVRDDTDRFSYWPVRNSLGGEMIIPGDPKDPVQVVDVRDLAAFAVHCIERKTVGVMNVTGPVKPITWGETIAACDEAAKRVGKTAANKTWISAEWLEKQGEGAGGAFPIWIPPTGEYAGFHQRSIAKAVAAGLTTRPVADTCEEILKWWPGEVERRTRVTKELKEAAKAKGKPEPQMPDPSKLKTGLPAEREAELIKKWKDEKK